MWNPPHGARAAEAPRELQPQLATPADAPPSGDEWIHEIKYDGYRILAFTRSTSVRLVSRSGLDWTERFPQVADAVGTLGLTDAILDGEVVVADSEGRPSFQALQNAVEAGRRASLQYMVFDLPFYGGYDLRNCSLVDRKEFLRTILASAGDDTPIRYSDHVAGDGTAVFEQACRMGLEGIVSKRAGSAYVSRRTQSWIKVKCMRAQEFVIVGFTEPQRSRTGFGALLLGYYSGPRLVYCGKVGTGFDEAALRSIADLLAGLEVAESPVSDGPVPSESGAHWVSPRLVCEVAFANWTGDGHLRHPSFRGLRGDKDARDVTRET